MTVKAYYPNRLKQDKYKTVTSSGFFELFPKLPENVVRLMVSEIVNCITDTITRPFSISEKELSEDHQSVKIKVMKDALNINYNNPTKKDEDIASWCGMLCRYRQNGEVTIKLAKYQITNAGLQYPEQQEVELLKFIKDAATKCTQEICQATELAIKQKESSKPWIEKIQSSMATEKDIKPKRIRFSERVEERTYSLESPPSKKGR